MNKSSIYVDREHPLAVYDYHDIAGEVLFHKVRFAVRDKETDEQVGKSFQYKWRSPEDRVYMNTWTVTKPPFADSIPYKLRDLYDAVADNGDVLICEGEKDADNIAAAWGYITTSHHGGSDGWQPGMARWIAKALRVGCGYGAQSEFYIAVDRDAAGVVLAAQCGRVLVQHGHVAPGRVHYVRTPVHELGADLTDHLAAGLTDEDLVEMSAGKVRGLARKAAGQMRRAYGSGSWKTEGFKDAYGSDSWHLAEKIKDAGLRGKLRKTNA